jgi:integrase
MAKVTLYLRFENSRGERSFARPVASNGKPLTDTGIPKPLYAFVNGRAEHHPEGQYFLRYTQNGKRMWENVGADCWVALDKKALRERSLRDQERGAAPAGLLFTSQTHIALADAVEQYSARVKAMKAKRTGETYSCALNGFLNSCSKVYLDEIRVDDLENFQVRLRAQGQSDRTTANRVGQVVTFLRKHGIQNVSLRPGYLRKKVLPYSEDDLRRLFEAATEDEKLLFSFFLGTGAREQEAAFATYGDIDFENKLFLVRAKPDLGFMPKDREERSVPIPDKLIEVLRERRKLYPDARLIFPNAKGNPQGHLLRVLKDRALAAGLNCGHCTGLIGKKTVSCRIHPVCRHWILHRFRKTFATMHHQDGASVHDLQDWLGHSSLETTLLYLGLSDKKSVRVRNLVNNSRVATFT